MGLSFGSITVNTASDWVAADILLRAELQSINAELNQLTNDLERAKASNDEERVSDIESKLSELQDTRKNVVKNISDYNKERRSKLS